MHIQKIFTWHTHGSYLYYLTQTPGEWYLPIGKPNRPGYGGKAGTFDWTAHVHEIAVAEIKNETFDVIIYQDDDQYLHDQYELLSDEQRKKARKIYIEHDPPREHPTDTKHPVTDPEVTVVHVTHFNDLMWDTGVPTTVIEHGILIDPEAQYTGEKDRGVVVVNNLKSRGRRLGYDIYREIKKTIPLDLIGMGSGEVEGGIGEIPPDQIAKTIGSYRFFFNPIRYTSLGLAVCEAMMIGMPVIGLATTEMSTAVKNNYNGYADTNIDMLVTNMQKLIEDRVLAREWGRNAEIYAKQRFNINRFTGDWIRLLQ